jgi:hypothetical protein
LRDYFKNRLFFKIDYSLFFLDLEKKTDFFSFFCLDMMTDTAIQQSTDTNGQTLVTQAERQALIQKL